VRRLTPAVLPPWTIPFLILGLVAPVIAAFALAGPGLGLAVGTLMATALIIAAARLRYDEPIEVAPASDRRFRLLVLAAEPADHPDVVEAIAGVAAEGVRALRADHPSGPELLVVAPASSGTLARWASDLGDARYEAQRRLALSLGALAAAGLEARGAVGDADSVQAVEDALRSFPAQEIAFVTATDAGSHEVGEIRRRLDRPVRHLVTASGASS
jgi:hypothetical protein